MQSLELSARCRSTVPRTAGGERAASDPDASSVRVAEAVLLALCLIVAAGCGGPAADRYVPSPADALAAVQAALDAWRAGTPPGPVPDTAPVVHVTDSYRRPGETLREYRILGETPSDAPRCYMVELQFSPPREEKARFVVVGIDPLWVFRLEDYQLLAHWEHRMDDGQAAAQPPGAAPAPGGGRSSGGGAPGSSPP